MGATRIILLLAAIGAGSGRLPAKSHRESRANHPVPPDPRFDGVFEDGHNYEEIGNRIFSGNFFNLRIYFTREFRLRS
ncbi:hypothetical protein EAI_10566 [Harpegnathos saltator]|uniref:Uncharacterized protein n=1 Tax=Harpegnathos saltator TaxID=610380 RepID=E2B7R9_HARSA|nr:hypothetical protein EAI_10566 [Harpegnathos saltator]